MHPALHHPMVNTRPKAQPMHLSQASKQWREAYEAVLHAGFS